MVEVEASPQYHYQEQPPERIFGEVVEWNCKELDPYIFPTVTVKKRTLYGKLLDNFE